MTAEMQEILEREMDDAMKVEDPQRRTEAMTCVMGHQLRALIDCSRKTANRVKEVRAHDDVVDGILKEMSKTLASCNESNLEYRRARQDVRAVRGFLGFCGRYVWPVVRKVIETIGAPTAAIVFCKLTGILW